MWEQHPSDYLKLKIAGRDCTAKRFSQSFLKSYEYSGQVATCSNELPVQVERLLEWARKIEPTVNQVLINWYEHDGSIGAHSDSEHQLIPNSRIFSFSFGPPGMHREFILRRKLDKSELRVKLKNNCCLIMGGMCQKSHTHEVPAIRFEPHEYQQQRRINITMRSFL